jgi:hypothetical protein
LRGGWLATALTILIPTDDDDDDDNDSTYTLPYLPTHL